MPLWRFIPVADKTDSHWQDRRIWHDVIVRAPTAAMARVLADDAEARMARGAVGNETRSYRGGFGDANLYWVRRLPKEDAGKFGGDNGEMGVVQSGTPEYPELSVHYGPSMIGREDSGGTGREPKA